VHHELHPVADAEHGNAGLEELAGGAGRSRTVDGVRPPERMIARGRRSRISSIGRLKGSTSQKTESSRILRAMSCVNCEPKSRMRNPAAAHPRGESPGDLDGGLRIRSWRAAPSRDCDPWRRKGWRTRTQVLALDTQPRAVGRGQRTASTARGRARASHGGSGGGAHSSARAMRSRRSSPMIERAVL
jgi:hypothetical protein